MWDKERLYFCVDGDKPLLQQGIGAALRGESTGQSILWPAEECGAEPALLLLCTSGTEEAVPTLQRYRDRYPPLNTILLYDGYGAADLYRCLSMGCRCVVKSTLSKADLLICIGLMERGFFLWDMDPAAKLLEEAGKYHRFVSLMREGIGAGAPTPRELEIAKYILSGLDNKEIGKRLYLSAGTVKNYVAVILEKYNFSSRAQIVRLLAM